MLSLKVINILLAPKVLVVVLPNQSALTVQYFFVIVIIGYLLVAFIEYLNTFDYILL